MKLKPRGSDCSAQHSESLGFEDFIHNPEFEIRRRHKVSETERFSVSETLWFLIYLEFQTIDRIYIYIYIYVCVCVCYVEENRSLLWSSGQSSWLLSGDVFCLL
jgi:hypothetical protein